MYFLPEFGSTPILMNELAAYLASGGHHVEVITTLPRRPADNKYKRRIFLAEHMPSFDVSRFWTNSSGTPQGRLIAWTIYSFWSSVNIIFSRKAGLVFLRLPPLQLGIVGLLAKKLKGSRVILNIQDIHPDLVIESGILRNPFLVKLAYRLEKWVYSFVDLIIVISEGFRDNLIKKGVRADKIKVVPNWVDTELVRPMAKKNRVSERFVFGDKFVIMYAGTITLSSFMSLDLLLDAALSLKEDKDIFFVIVGEGLKKDSLVEKAKMRNLSNVIFIPFLPYEDMPFLLASGDLLVVPLDVNKTELSLPSKLYSYMASGRPILCLAKSGSEIDTFIKQVRCGISLDPYDAVKIKQAILELKKSPDYRRILADNGRNYVLENFSKEKILKVYEEEITR